MSFIYEQPLHSEGDTFAGGEASLGEIMQASLDDAKYVSNSLSSAAAEEQAFDDRIEAVRKATGVKLDNPYRDAVTAPGSFPSGDQIASFANREQIFLGAVDQATRNLPDQNVADQLRQPISSDAARIAQRAEARSAQLFSSRTGYGKYGAALAGGFLGMLRDPLQAAAMIVGGGAGAAGTVAGRILQTTAREALANAGAQAITEPFVQAWRKKAGLEYGVDRALTDIATAGAIGGTFGAGARGLAELVRPIRAALPAEARGAIDATDALAIVEDNRPEAALPPIHEENLGIASRAIAAEEPPVFTPDEAQIRRVVDQLVPQQPAAKAKGAKGPRNLVDFLIDAGGVKDFQGELRAIGADGVSRPFGGKLAREDGMALDGAREAAAEAGYLDHIYGDPETAVARSTVADLLDQVDRSMRGDEVLPGGEVRQALPDVAAARDSAETMLRRMVEDHGPGLPDHHLREAAEISAAEGIDPSEALERVLTRAEDRPVAGDEIVGDLPAKGLAPANKYADGKTYVGRPGDLHFSISERYPHKLRGDLTETGFITPDGHYLSREAAFDWVAAHEKPVRSTDGISGASDDRKLDAADYREQVREGSKYAPPRPGRTGEPLPGWSDAELEAASARRGNPPVADGIDEPGKPDEDLGLSPADVEEYGDELVPGENGELVPLSTYAEDIARGEELATVVKACKE